MEAHLQGRSADGPDVPPRHSRLSLCGMRAQLKGFFNPGENGCHSGLAQKLAKSTESETEKLGSKQRGVSM